MRTLGSLVKARCALERRRTWDAAELEAWRSLFQQPQLVVTWGKGFCFVDREPVRARALDLLHAQAAAEDKFRAAIDALGLRGLL